MTTPHPSGRWWRPARLLRVAAIGLLAMAFVVLLPVAPGQQQSPPGSGPGTGTGVRDLGTVRTDGAGATPAAEGAGAAGVTGPASLRYRPFIDPVRAPVHTHWYVLLLPMSLGIAVVYKAVMMRTLDRYWHEVLYLTVQIVVGMIVLGLASYLLVMWYVPMVAGGR